MGTGRAYCFPHPPLHSTQTSFPEKSLIKGHNYSKSKLHKDTAGPMCKRKLTARKQANLSRQVE